MKTNILLLSVSILVISFLSASCSSDDDSGKSNPTQFTDPRDHQVYDIVTLGNQTWFAENLNYEIDPLETPCYEGNSENCFIYGRLYSHENAEIACPQGWHLPSKEEWEELFDYLGGINTAHAFMAPYASLQGEEVGFNMLASGSGDGSSNFSQLTERGYYWTSTSDGNLQYHYIYYIPGNSINMDEFYPDFKFSCRCIKD